MLGDMVAPQGFGSCPFVAYIIEMEKDLFCINVEILTWRTQSTLDSV